MSNVCTFKITEINTMYIQIKNITYIHIFFLLQRRVRARLRWRTPVHVKVWWSSSRPLWTAWSRSHRNISFKTKNTWYQVILYLQVKTSVFLHIKSLVIALGGFFNNITSVVCFPVTSLTGLEAESFWGAQHAGDPTPLCALCTSFFFFCYIQNTVSVYVCMLSTYDSLMTCPLAGMTARLEQLENQLFSRKWSVDFWASTMGWRGRRTN